MKPIKILDICCCQGGASKGMKDACPDAEIIGIDINPQSDYPYTFIQEDVRKLTVEFIKQFDFVWASVPCQAYIYASKKARNLGKKYPELIEVVRKKLIKSGIPFVMENCPTAPLRKDLMLCGEMFGLKIIRHRIFEIHGFKVEQPEHQKHKGKVKDGCYVTVAGHGGDGKASLKAFQDAMEITWTKDKKAICEAVPPRYAEYIMYDFLEQRKKGVEDVACGLDNSSIPRKTKSLAYP